ncbi:MAG: hypothetical protein AB7J28_08165 [Hyphomonadaceae bacterium]
MLRTVMLALASAAALTAIVGCATEEDRRIRAAQEATCRTPESTPEEPRYDGRCMRTVEEQVRAARLYRPSTKAPKQKGK